MDSVELNAAYSYSKSPAWVHTLQQLDYSEFCLEVQQDIRNRLKCLVLLCYHKIQPSGIVCWFWHGFQNEAGYVKCS